VTTNVVRKFGPWNRSLYSSDGDNCVDGTAVWVRDSKAPADPPCALTAAAWEPLLVAASNSVPADVRPDVVCGDKADVRSSLTLTAAVWQPAGPEAAYAFVDYTDGATYVALRAGTVVLLFTMAEWDAFVAGVRDGEFTLARLARQQENTPLFALVQAEAAAARGAAAAEASGFASEELVADRRREVVAELRDRD
jgi:Domain of unknown function (DUF397)